MSAQKVVIFLALALAIGESQNVKHPEITVVDVDAIASLQEILDWEFESVHKKIDTIHKKIDRLATTTTTPTTTPPNSTTTTNNNNEDVLKWIEQNSWTLGITITMIILLVTILVTLVTMICLARKKSQGTYNVELEMAKSTNQEDPDNM